MSDSLSRSDSIVSDSLSRSDSIVSDSLPRSDYEQFYFALFKKVRKFHICQYRFVNMLCNIH